jgi:hypothetical protein
MGTIQTGITIKLPISKHAIYAGRFIATSVLIIVLMGWLTACGGGAGGSGDPVGPAKSLTVLTTNVPEGAQAVDPRASFQFVFSSSFGVPDPTSDQVELSDGSNTYPVKINIVGGILTVTPVAGLHTRTNYRLTIKSGVTASDGAVLRTNFILNFKTMIAVFENKLLVPQDRTVRGGAELPRIVITDVNRDGRPDLVELAALDRPDLLAANGYTINIFLQNSAGTFDKVQRLEIVTDQLGYIKDFSNLIVMDTDGDKMPELLVPEYRTDDEATTGIRVFKANSDGKFAEYDFIVTTYAQTLQAVDVDGDGQIDLVGSNRWTTDRNTGGFQVLRRTADGFTKIAPVTLPAGVYEIAIADLDQDGKNELIINRSFDKPGSGPIGNELLVYSQGAAGVFSLNPQLTGDFTNFCTEVDYCRNMKVIDLNGDRNPELVFGGQTSSISGIYVSTINYAMAFSRQADGTVTKNFQVDIGDSASVFQVRDLDNDGVPDLLVVSSRNYYSIIGGGPNFSLEYFNVIKVPVFDSMNPANVAIGDIDGDGQLDIVFDSYNSGIVMARRIKF